jgi:hypothetical protein
VATDWRRWIGTPVARDRMQMGINDFHCARLDPPAQWLTTGSFDCRAHGRAISIYDRPIRFGY